MLKSNLKYGRMIKDPRVPISELDCVEEVVVAGHYSTIIAEKLSPKMEDLGSFILTSNIREVKEIKGLFVNGLAST